MAFKTRRPRGGQVVSRGGFSHRPRRGKRLFKRQKIEIQNERIGKEVRKFPGIGQTESNNDDDGSEEYMDISIESTMATDGTAYNALLCSLRTSGGEFAAAYKQRKREEQGGSESEDEEEVGEQEADEDEGDLEEEEDEDEDEEEVKSTEAMNGGTSKGVRANSKDKLHEKENGNENGASSRNGIHNEEEEEEEENEEGDKEEEHLPSTPTNDTFEQHVGRMMTDAELAGLTAGKQKFGTNGPALGVPGGKWLTTLDALPKVEPLLSQLSLKSRLRDEWNLIHEGKEANHGCGDFESEDQAQFFSFCNSYVDILHSSRPSLAENPTKLMDAYLLHALNHVLKSRDRIVKNNEKLSKAAKAEAEAEAEAKAEGGRSDTNGGDAAAEAPRDQGFTRPKVLLLLPFRSMALRAVQRLLELAPKSQKTSVEHRERFMDDFGVEEEEEEEEEAGKGGKSLLGQKPADYRALFSGNNDDHFRIGVKLTRKSIKLYSEFYSSDIIIASPIGLVTQIGEAQADKDKDLDFLSSIEIVVVDTADVILMQNWSHLSSVFEALNKIPTKQHGTDFMRIREWYLNGWAKHYRQTIVLSAFTDPAINALFHRTCANHAGKVKLRCEYGGVLSKVVPQVRQVYEKLDCDSIASAEDVRFEYFTKVVFPRIRDSIQGGTMLFVRSYFEFVRLRNFLKAEGASFALLGEYTKQSDISRARSWFFHGTRRILLYTERAHFYHRYRIRGIREIIFLSLPENPGFYAELLNLLEGTENPTCSVVFSRFDNLQLERIVGSSRSKKMLLSQNKTFMFC